MARLLRIIFPIGIPPQTHSLLEDMIGQALANGGWNEGGTFKPIDAGETRALQDGGCRNVVVKLDAAEEQIMRSH